MEATPNNFTKKQMSSTVSYRPIGGVMKNQLLEKFHNSLSKIKWNKAGLVALYIVLGLTSAGILALSLSDIRRLPLVRTRATWL